MTELIDVVESVENGRRVLRIIDVSDRGPAIANERLRHVLYDNANAVIGDFETGQVRFVMRPTVAREYWQQYLHPCCEGCRSGTADCDVNPLHEPPTQAECAIELMRLGECP